MILRRPLIRSSLFKCFRMMNYINLRHKWTEIRTKCVPDWWIWVICQLEWLNLYKSGTCVYFKISIALVGYWLSTRSWSISQNYVQRINFMGNCKRTIFKLVMNIDQNGISIDCNTFYSFLLGKWYISSNHLCPCFFYSCSIKWILHKQNKYTPLFLWMRTKF